MTRARLVAACLASSDRDAQLRAVRKCCAAVTCGAEISPSQIFCRDHFAFLPQWLRRAILNTFTDAEWDAHREAIRQGADFIDNAQLAARDAGFTTLHSGKLFRNARSRGAQVRFMGRAVL